MKHKKRKKLNILLAKKEKKPFLTDVTHFWKKYIFAQKRCNFCYATYKKYAKKRESLRLKRAFLQVTHIFYIKIANFSLKYIYIIISA